MSLFGINPSYSVSSDQYAPPSLTYPMGGDVVIGNTIVITWDRPADASSINSPIWYEIFFTDSFESKEESSWVQIASVPSKSSSFSWKIPNGVRGDRCRIAIRSRDLSGVRSIPSYSSRNFSIQRKALSSPAVISPVENETYRFFVPFAIDHSAIDGTVSSRAYYSIQYSSKAKAIEWTTIKSNLRVGTSPFYWDARDVDPSNDYMFKISLIDDAGNASVPALIENVTISSLNYFWLDTTPPKGTIKIQNVGEYTKERDIVVSLVAFDEITGVKSVTLQQRTPEEVSDVGSEQSMSNIKTISLIGDDGVKYIDAIFKDAGENILQSGLESSFRTLFSNDSQIDSILIVPKSNSFDIWSTLGGSSPELIKNQSVFLSLDDRVNTMSFFEDTIYLGAKTSSDTGKLQRLIGNTLTTIYSFSENDSYIVSLVGLSSKLYVGLRNGDLYSFDGSSMRYITTFNSEINAMYSDGSLLFIAIEKEDQLQIYDGNTFMEASHIDAR